PTHIYTLSLHDALPIYCSIYPSGEAAMSVAKAEPKRMSDAEVVEAYLTASMIPDPEAASAYMKPGTIITFTGGREFDHPRGPTGDRKSTRLNSSHVAIS